MTLKTDMLADLVAIQLGEFPDWQAAVMAGGADPVLRNIVRRAAPTALTEITLKLPPDQCRDVKPLAEHIHQNTDWGFDCIYPCAMPADFLRLHSLRMPDWGAPLSEENPSDTLRLQLGENAPEWLAGRTLRPMLRIARNGDGACELWFGPTAHSTPAEAAYIAAPDYDSASDSFVNVQPAAIVPLAEKLAAMIADFKI